MGEIERLVADADDGTVDDEFLRHLYRGGELLSGGQVEEARAPLERAYELHPKNPKAQNLLGLTYFKLGVFDKAAEIYEILVRDNPVDPTLRVNLGLVYLKQNALSRATREFETAVDLSPDHKKAQNYLGLAYAQTGDYHRAKDCFVAAGSLSMAEKMDRALRETSADPAEPAQPQETNIAVRPEDASAVPGAPAGAAGEPADAELPALQVQAEGERLSGAVAEGAGAPEGAAEPVREEVAATMPQAPQDAQPWAQPVAAATAEVAEAAPREDSVEVPAAEALGTEVPAAEMPAAEALGTEVPAAEMPAAEALGSEVPAAEMPAIEALGAEVPVAEVSTAEVPEAWTQPQPPMAAPSLAELTRALAIAPADAGEPFEATSEIVVVRVRGEVLTRLEGLLAATGGLSYLPEMKRFRGRATDKAFGDGERRMVRASGRGTLVLAARERVFVPVELADDSAYFREDAIFAFEESVVFENGRVPSKIAPDLHLVHLRGRGRVLLCSGGPLHATAVVAGEPVAIPMAVLLGWHGGLTPRIVGLPEEREGATPVPAVELSGDGYALIAPPRAVAPAA